MLSFPFTFRSCSFVASLAQGHLSARLLHSGLPARLRPIRHNDAFPHVCHHHAHGVVSQRLKDPHSTSRPE
eukprot:5130023-Pyramimonas_sp.AAC.1